MGVIFNERDARRIQKCVQAFERSGHGGRGQKRRHFNYPDGQELAALMPAAVYWSARNTTQVVSAAATATIDFDSEGPKSGSMWSLDATTGILTVNATFEAECSISVPWGYDAVSADEINSIGVYLERNSTTIVPRSMYDFPLYYITTNLSALFGVLGRTFPLSITSGDTFRVRFANGTAGVDIELFDETIPGSGASWSIRAVGPIS